MNGLPMNRDMCPAEPHTRFGRLSELEIGLDSPSSLGIRHCQLPASQRPEVEAFVDKFLLGKEQAQTLVDKHPFDKVEYEFWYDGWTKGKSTFPMPDATNVESVFVEAEESEQGSDWNVEDDTKASGGKYVTIQPGKNSPQSAPSEKSGVLRVPFRVTQDAKYYLFVRVNCPSADDDSFWVKLDDGPFAMANGLRTNGWEWVKLDAINLEPGEHTLTMTYREDGAKLDRIGLTTYVFGPAELESH